MCTDDVFIHVVWPSGTLSIMFLNQATLEASVDSQHVLDTRFCLTKSIMDVVMFMHAGLRQPAGVIKNNGIAVILPLLKVSELPLNFPIGGLSLCC